MEDGGGCGEGADDDDDDDEFNAPPPPPSLPGVIRYIDFYSGVGGWTMALKQAAAAVQEGSDRTGTGATTASSTPLLRLQCCAALDHSDLCLKVYSHNFDVRSGTSTSSKAVRIQDLAATQLIEWDAHLWLMSPPCQPHTRQHSNRDRDLDDPRSRSFLHLCDLLEDLPARHRPVAVLLENVDGFQRSKSAERFLEVLGGGRRFA